jgi:hypothetical protein
VSENFCVFGFHQRNELVLVPGERTNAEMSAAEKEVIVGGLKDYQQVAMPVSP